MGFQDNSVRTGRDLLAALEATRGTVRELYDRLLRP
jgi:hypothetical protein